MRLSASSPWLRCSASLSMLIAWAGSGVMRAEPPAPASGSSAFAMEAVKAAYLVNFIRFTDWPAEVLPASAPFVVGVSGNRALEDELIRLADRQLVRERRLRIIRLKTPRDLDGCNLVYFDPSMEPGEDPSISVADSLPLLQGRPVLTISESPAFLSQGGIINLYRDGGNLRFEISTEAARTSGLVFSSRLLANARIVRPAPAPPQP